jgi:muconolactone delta-isomerase
VHPSLAATADCRECSRVLKIAQSSVRVQARQVQASGPKTGSASRVTSSKSPRLLPRRPGRPELRRRTLSCSPAAFPAGAMEYLVTMTTRVPDGTPEEAVQDIRTREAAHSRDLAAQGHLLRLWRPPLRDAQAREAQAARDLAGQGHLLRLRTLPDERTLGLYRGRDAAPGGGDPGVAATGPMDVRGHHAAVAAPQRPGDHPPADHCADRNAMSRTREPARTT